jgi:hypothetical protein
LALKRDFQEMKEKPIEQAFEKFCQSKACQCLKLRIDGMNGWPDRTVITPKGVFFAEFKTQRGRLRAAQTFWRELLTSLGYVVLVPRRVGEAEEFLERWLRR